MQQENVLAMPGHKMMDLYMRKANFIYYLKACMNGGWGLGGWGKMQSHDSKISFIFFVIE